MGRDLAMGMPAQGRRRAPSARDEAALVRAAKRGSADAVEALVRGHWDGAHRTAFLIVRDAAAAEDIAQEAVLAAVRRIDDFDRRRPFRPWLHRIVVNRSLDWLRARQRRQEVSLDELPAAAAPDQRPAARLGARGGLALARIEAPLRTQVRRRPPSGTVWLVPPREHTVTGPGGRTLQVREDGDRGGVPLIAHHGTPGSRLLYRRWVEDAADRGIRLIAYDRPGYGGSDRHAGRAVADAAADVEAIADALGLDRILVDGRSGGGPHALACAALLGDRVAAAATLCSVAPYGAEGLDFTVGMGEDNVIEFGAALEGPEKLGPLLEEFAPRLLAAEPEQLVASLRSLLSPPDVAVVDGGLAEELIAATREGIAAGREGWLDDDLAFTRPWGFEVGSISVPLQLWQGRQDLMVPPAHGEWLAARIPGVDARLSDEDGHLSVEHLHIGDVHAWLLERY